MKIKSIANINKWVINNLHKMSSKDETDLVRNKESSTEQSTVQSLKSNIDPHDRSNGNAAASVSVNGDNSINLNDTIEHTAIESSMKSNTPSNWVQFENDDDSDKVGEYLHLFDLIQRKNRS